MAGAVAAVAFDVNETLLDLEPLRPRLAAGVRTATLTNGSAALAEQVLERGGVAHLLDLRMTVAEVGRWKPAPEPYRHAAWRLGVRPGQLALVAAHPWDLGGAARAG